MNDFCPSSFFCLEDFEHSLLFEEKSCVWTTLLEIEGYLKKLPMGKIEGEVSPLAFLFNPEQISIGKGSIVEAGAYIQGPCFIGENNLIRHGAYIRGGVITSKECIIGHGTEVKNSIFFKGAKAPHFNYVGDSILGEGVNLGAGVKLANFRLDGGEISFFWKSEKVFTGLKKFGAILGSGVQLGCNSVTNPGTMIAPHLTYGACSVLSGPLFPEKIIQEERV